MGASSRLYRILDLVATISIIVVACAILWLVWGRAQNQGDQRASPRSGTYDVGSQIGDIDNVTWSDAGVTAVIWLNSSCQFCDQSMEFYRRLVAKPRVGRVIAMGSEDRGVIHAYLLKHGVEPDQIVSVVPGRLKVVGTPTLLLVDSGGLVTESWIGRIRTKNAEDLILKAVR